MWNKARVAGCLALITVSSGVFILWGTIVEMSGPIGQKFGSLEILYSASRAAPVVIMVIALPMLMPWWFVIRLSERVHHFRPLYFCLAGGVSLFITFTATAALMPARHRSLFYNDIGTWFESRGIMIMVSGMLGGLAYWLVSGKLSDGASAGSPNAPAISS